MNIPETIYLKCSRCYYAPESFTMRTTEDTIKAVQKYSVCPKCKKPAMISLGQFTHAWKKKNPLLVEAGKKRHQGKALDDAKNRSETNAKRNRQSQAGKHAKARVF